MKKYLGHKPSYLKAVILYTLTFSFLRKKKTFAFKKELPYFNHRYNLTFLNERRVEIPLVMSEIENFTGRMLEVGNVLYHYGVKGHVVVDKYEQNVPGVINKDIVDLGADQKFDFIVTISTVEHIGQDENEDPAKAISAIKHMASLLNPNGKLLVTFPMGYNPALDQWLYKENYFSELHFLKRHNVFNEWKVVSKDEARGSKFSSPYPLGNTIAIGYLNS